MNEMTGIIERIEAKKMAYRQYDFTGLENVALMTFFDLAQEFDKVEDFYKLCVAIPASFFGLDARLYLYESPAGAVRLAATTDSDEAALLHPPHADADLQPYYTDKSSLVLPIRGKRIQTDHLSSEVRHKVLGLLEVYPIGDMNVHNRLFFEKFANRIGFSMHNRLLAARNIEHLRFINTLVADIEHNVIVPNMIYKLFLRRLKGKIKKNHEIEERLSASLEKGFCDRSDVEILLKELGGVNQGLDGEYENIEKHYRNMSLFLETLFRRSHFDQGRLTLRTKSCNVKKDIVQPQLERYVEQFEKAGIEIDDNLSGIPDEEVISVVDVGLIAQVYANLFSNALKYTQEIEDDSGKKRKYLSYGRETLRDYFGKGKDGIKYNVFTTGPHIPAEERGRIFEEEFRGSNTLSKPGTGHGLAFIKNAIEMHGGIVGYEATKDGNNFFFVIPKRPEITTPRSEATAAS